MLVIVFASHTKDPTSIIIIPYCSAQIGLAFLISQKWIWQAGAKSRRVALLKPSRQNMNVLK